MRLLGGYFVFDSPDAALLVSLLPALVHVRGVERLSILVRLVGEEARERRGRDATSCSRAWWRCCSSKRCGSRTVDAPPGLLRGLADARLAPAIRQMHERSRALVDGGPTREDGRAVALGVLRALHAHRRRAADGVPARLAHGGREGSAPPAATSGIAEVAERVGYGSASTFSTAFSRHVGQPPGRYARSSPNQMGSRG